MPSALFNSVNQNNQNSIAMQIQQLKAQFAPGTDPMQIIQQMMQQGRVTQEQVNAAFAQMQQLFPQA